MKRGKGVILVSGGLDSLLAAQVLIEQGLDITGFHCILPFVDPDYNPLDLSVAKLASQIKLPMVFHRCESEYIDIICNPAHGYGKYANPCIDCHIYFIKQAAVFMKEINADFVATGEVVGQRPMSQMRHTLNHIEKATGLQGRLIRPLSAKLLKPTIPETEGIVNRDMLLSINGRSRREQLELVGKYNIPEFASPSGGCLFTDKYISNRVKDLIVHHFPITAYDFYLLTIGRHFRINVKAKIIVARNELETNNLFIHSQTADYYFIPEFKGPTVYVKGCIENGEIDIIGSIILRYSKTKSDSAGVSIFHEGSFCKIHYPSHPASDEYLEKIRI